MTQLDRASFQQKTLFLQSLYYELYIFTRNEQKLPCYIHEKLTLIVKYPILLIGPT